MLKSWRPAFCGALAGVGATSFYLKSAWGANRPSFVTEADLKKQFQKFKPHDVPLPTNKMLQEVKPGTNPVVLVACGSFSPPTNMHLRIFEDAKVAVEATGKYTVIGGYLSPVHINYGKKSLLENYHRVNLVRAAIADSCWLMDDVWECAAQDYTPTALVLDKIRERLSELRVKGSNSKIKVMFVCGADLLESFPVVKENGENLWSPEHQRIILQQNGVACLCREGVDLPALIRKHAVLDENKANIEVVKPACENSISSTAVRRELHGGSVKYLIPDAVIDYIHEHNLSSKPQWKP